MRHEAIVVGSGPNGLAAAITLARAGRSVLVVEGNRSIGGGARSAELTLPGFLHDICSAVHPLAVASPFFRSLPLSDYGLTWIEPEISLAHPLDDEPAVCLHRDLQKTEDSLGEDGRPYRALVEPFVRGWDALASEFLRPLLHLPRHPFILGRFGLRAMRSASHIARTFFRRERARALFGGMAAHSFLRLDQPGSAAFALVLAAAGHRAGWPIPQGGSQSISNALKAQLLDLGGEIVTGRRLRALPEVPARGAVLLDLTAWQFAGLAREQLPLSYWRRLAHFKHAPGVFKIDYALTDPVPWRDPACRRAGTVHVGGRFDEIAQAEAEVAAGEHPEQPFVLVAQQSLFDKTRAPTGQHTLWGYCHVPFGSGMDMSERVEMQIERFAPGFRDCILGKHQSRAFELAYSNRNLRGGDINAGALTLWQLIARPVLSPNPYRTPLPGVYLCSASTPPGPGVHGMCGFHAANLALRERFSRGAAKESLTA